jgi:glycosyltransferase involved in cell wall biosynthesis
MMKILQTIADLSAASGGPSTCTYDLLEALQRTDVEAKLVTLASNDDLGANKPWVTFLGNDAYTSVALSKNMARYLRACDVDLIHTNGLWLYTNHISAKVAREKGIPFVLTPHGMLIENAIKRQYFKKWPLLKLWFDRDIAGAACLHATCKAEAEYIRKFGYKGPVAVIPNPMPSVQWMDEITECHNTKRIGFLGRFHPVKRIDILIEAWRMLGEKTMGAELVLIGGGKPSYETYLYELAAQCKHGKVVFCGFMNGKEKFQELASLSALCLVSIFENFGMTVTEALSVGTPVIANLTTPWADLNEYGCGWWIDATAEQIAVAIEAALGLTDVEREAMAKRGKQLVERKYTAQRVAEMMAELYRWIGGEQVEVPKFVYLDRIDN